jgi:acetyltransferase-like isoleucine patch superfamily enzyme
MPAPDPPAVPARRSRPGVLLWRALKRLSARRRYWLLALRYPAIRAQPPFNVQPGTVFGVAPAAKLSFAPGLQLGRDFTAIVAGELRIGRGVFFNRGCYLSCLQLVEIGEHCMFGERVSIHDSNHVAELGVVRKRRPSANSPVRIGANVWVGANVVITAGVSIGDGAVIGAGAVVTRDVPPAHLAVGVPAVPRPLEDSTPEGEAPEPA